MSLRCRSYLGEGKSAEIDWRELTRQSFRNKDDEFQRRRGRIVAVKRALKSVLTWSKHKGSGGDREVDQSTTIRLTPSMGKSEVWIVQISSPSKEFDKGGKTDITVRLFQRGFPNDMQVRKGLKTVRAARAMALGMLTDMAYPKGVKKIERIAWNR